MHFFLPFLRVPVPALWVVSLAASFGLGCGASSPQEAVSPATPGQAVTLEQLVTLIAKPGQWPLDVGAAEQLLEALGPVRREQPVPEALSLRGGPSGVLNRYEVAYAADEQGGWTFDGAGFFLEDADLVRLHEAGGALLTERLGKAKWTEEGAGGPGSAGWELGGLLQLLFAPSPNAGERLLMISISAPEGEAD